MASNHEFVEYAVDQMDDAGQITAKKMFGEYGIYCDGTFFALICDNKLFIKPTGAGRNYIESLTEAPPYPGAKNYFLIEEKLDDRDWLIGLVQCTVGELPPPKPKRKKTKS